MSARLKSLKDSLTKHKTKKEKKKRTKQGTSCHMK